MIKAPSDGIVPIHPTLSVIKERREIVEQIGLQAPLLRAYECLATDESLATRLDVQQRIIAEAQIEIERVVSAHDDAPAKVKEIKSRTRELEKRVKLLDNSAKLASLAKLIRKVNLLVESEG